MPGSIRTQRALKVQRAGQIHLVEDAPLPEIGPEEVLVQVKAIAINPFDAKSLDLSPTMGATMGCDFAGVVTSLGEDVEKTPSINVGGRVCGFAFGNNPNRLDNGSFAEFVAAPAKLLMRIPKSMSFETATTFGVGVATTGLALFHEHQLALPQTSEANLGYVLVYGGSTATGTMMIQMLRLSGYRVVCTCSPHNFELVQSLGAEAAFDYHSPTCGSDIRDATANRLAHAVDCITNVASMKTCYEALGSAGGQYLALDSFPLRSHVRRSVKPTWIISLTMLGEKISWVKPYQRNPDPEHRAFAEKWMPLAEGLLADGKIVAHPHKIMSGGLASVAEGLDSVRMGMVSAMKLVYRVDN